MALFLEIRIVLSSCIADILRITYFYIMSEARRLPCCLRQLSEFIIELIFLDFRRQNLSTTKYCRTGTLGETFFPDKENGEF